MLVTKYRHKCITKPMLDRIKELFAKYLEQDEMKLIEFDGEADHIHCLFSSHPACNISQKINSMKTASSRIIRKEFAEHLKHYYWKPVFWKRGYCLVSTGGASMETIKKYIEGQQTPGEEEDTPAEGTETIHPATNF